MDGVKTELRARVQHALDQKTKPVGSLGRLEQVAIDLCVAQRTQTPDVQCVYGLIFAADHGVALDGVSAYPREVTAQMVLNIAGGGSAVSTIGRANGVEIEVFDVGVDAEFVSAPRVHDLRVRRGSGNIRVEPAMSEDELDAALSAGRRALQVALDAGARTVAIGEMGIGNTTPASAMIGHYLGLDAEEITGAGTGVQGAALQHKLRVVEEAILRVPKDASAREVLRQVGGLEIAAMVGVCLAAVEAQVAVIVDGFITTAAALAAVRMDSEVRDQLLFSHCSAEAGHRRVLQALDAAPLVELQMRLGEGSGAVLCVPLVRAAAAVLREMATFEQAGVTEKSAP